LTILIEKMDQILLLIKKLGSEIKEFRKNNPHASHEDLLIAQQKATRTSFELLRDEVDELVDIVVLTSKSS
jgi:NOL1/NOP2/fmu family ribosome biogenesis protein